MAQDLWKRLDDPDLRLGRLEGAAMPQNFAEHLLEIDRLGFDLVARDAAVGQHVLDQMVQAGAVDGDAFEVEPGVGVNLVAKFAVRRASLLHEYRAVLFEQTSVDHLQTFRADRLGRFRKTFFQRLDRGIRERRLGLNNFKVSLRN